MQLHNVRCVAVAATLALGGLSAACGANHQDAQHPSGGAVEAAAPSTPPAPSDSELDAKAKQAINDANADAEFEKLKQDIEAGGGG